MTPSNNSGSGLQRSLFTNGTAAFRQVFYRRCARVTPDPFDQTHERNHRNMLLLIGLTLNPAGEKLAVSRLILGNWHVRTARTFDHQADEFAGYGMALLQNGVVWCRSITRLTNSPAASVTIGIGCCSVSVDHQADEFAGEGISGKDFAAILCRSITRLTNSPAANVRSAFVPHAGVGRSPG